MLRENNSSNPVVSGGYTSSHVARNRECKLEYLKGIRMKMKLLPVAFSALIFTGCSTVGSGSNANSKIKIEPDRSVRITNAYVSQQEDELNVRGTLRPKSFMVKTAGHIHVRFLGVEGNTLEHLKVEPNINSFSRRSISPPRFSASTALAASDVWEIRLKHHNAPLEACN